MAEKAQKPAKTLPNIRFFIYLFLTNSKIDCKIIEKKRNKRTISGKYKLILHRETFKNHF